MQAIIDDITWKIKEKTHSNNDYENKDKDTEIQKQQIEDLRNDGKRNLKKRFNSNDLKLIITIFRCKDIDSFKNNTFMIFYIDKEYYNCQM